MTVRYEPRKILRKLAARKNVEKLLSKSRTTKSGKRKKEFGVNNVALNAIDAVDVVGKKQLERVALGVIKEYRERADNLRDLGATKAEAEREIVDDPRLLVQRIQNETVRGITTAIKEKYHGAFYTWLPSTANEPDKKHRKKWGKRYRIGKGESPGDRYGCQCGMEIHVPESRLALE